LKSQLIVFSLILACEQLWAAHQFWLWSLIENDWQSCQCKVLILYWIKTWSSVNLCTLLLNFSAWMVGSAWLDEHVGQRCLEKE
jgi:hypothetical protein